MNRTLVWGFVLLTILDTTAQVCFKLAASAAAPFAPDLPWLVRVLSASWLYCAIACYIGTFFAWMTLLRRAPVGPAFAATHLDVVTVLAASALLLHEHVTSIELTGAALIVAGIVCLARAESQPRRDAQDPFKRATPSQG